MPRYDRKTFFGNTPKPRQASLVTLLIVTTLSLTVNLGLPVTISLAEESVEVIENRLEEKLRAKGDLERELAEVSAQLKDLTAGIAALGGKLFLTQKDLDRVTTQAKDLGSRIELLSRKLDQAREDVSAKELLRNSFVRRLYKEHHIPGWEVFLETEAFAEFSKALVYQSATVADLKERITTLNADIARLELDKTNLTNAKTALDAEAAKIAVLRATLAKQKQAAEAEAKEVSSRQDAISGELSSLSAEVRELVRAKLAATAEDTSVGDTEPLREEIPDPPFSPAYAVFSRGYPHRVGMSQYGAFGRAKEGQGYEEILKSYYDGVEIVDYDCPETIKIRGSFGAREVSFEENYLKGIAEMPSSWGDQGGMEALMAQAIAARTYALAYTRDGDVSICITQACQVYRESKVSSDAAANWHQAVAATRGKVLVYHGSPIKAWYASTAGGATRLPTDFDVKWESTPPYVRRLIDNPKEKLDYWADSYDKDSPWFYKAWYDPEVDGTPWLTEEEMEDLLNAAMLLASDADLEGKLVQERLVAFKGVAAGWDKAEVRQELKKRDIEPVGEIAAIDLADDTEGYTRTVSVVSEKYPKGKDIDGRAFRKIFIIRSPGYLALWSSLYDIVRK